MGFKLGITLNLPQPELQSQSQTRTRATASTQWVLTMQQQSNKWLSGLSHEWQSWFHHISFLCCNECDSFLLGFKLATTLNLPHLAGLKWSMIQIVIYSSIFFTKIQVFFLQCVVFRCSPFCAPHCELFYSSTTTVINARDRAVGWNFGQNYR